MAKRKITGPFKLHVFCWTHLDREWDWPFEATRADFLDIIEEIADMLEKHPDYRVFHLDGQVVPLVDHLAVRPQNRVRLERLVRAGRLLIGPYYALPEMNVIAGECIARNFLLGRKVGETFGPIMKVGLSNTGWGQVSQMPQILRNFGIDSYMSYRGVPVHRIDRECLWEGPDGSRVVLFRPSPGPRSIFFVTIMLPAELFRWAPAGQERTADPKPGVRLAEGDSGPLEPYFAEHDPDRVETEHVQRRMKRILDTLAPDATTRHLWLGNWQDAMHPHPRLMEVLDEARKALPPGCELVVGSLPEYVAATKRERPDMAVQVRGEMRSPRKSPEAAEMMNVLSTRPMLKVANRTAEQALIYGAECWSAVAAAMGMKHPADLLERAWKLLIVNQCHDTIGGVGVDRIHEDQVNRFARVGDLARFVERKALAFLVRRTGFAPRQDGDGGLTVFNPMPFARSGVIECSLDAPAKFAKRSIRVLDADDQPIPCEILSARNLDTKVYAPFDRYAMMAVKRFRVRLRVEDVPACGWANYTVRPAAEEASNGQPMRGGDDWMANEHLRVSFAADGTFALRSKLAGRTFGRCGWYEDAGNIWNGWGYEPPADDVRVTSLGGRARVRRVVRSPLRTTFAVETTLRIPFAANPERTRRGGRRVPLRVRSEFTLLAGDPVLHVRTRFDNTARDHRLRVMFPSVRGAKHSWAEAPFDVVRRDIALPDSAGWAERHQGTQPMLSFADVSDGRAGLAVIPRGLCEYEAIDDAARTLAVTLVRAYTHRHPLNHNTLAPEVAGSNCPGPHELEYGLYPHAGDWQAGRVARVAYDALAPLTPVQHFGTSLPGERRRSFFQITSDRLILHAAKRAERGRAIVLRLGNPTGRKVAARIGCCLPIRKAELCTMAEEPREKLAVGRDRCVRVAAGPHQVLTLRLTLAD